MSKKVLTAIFIFVVTGSLALNFSGSGFDKKSITQPKGRVLPAETEKDSPDSIAAKDESEVLQAKEGETELINERTENFKKFDSGNGEYRVAGDTGPIHYKSDPFSKTEQFKEIDLTIREHTKSGSDDWDYATESNGYQVRIWNSRNDGGQDIPYIAQFRRAGKYLEMAPSELIWENEAGDREVISKPIAGIKPEIDNENYTITWKNVFGDGIDFRYNLSPDKFFKTVIVNKKENLPRPTIDANGLKLTVVMALLWDEQVKASNDFAKDKENTKLDGASETDKLDKNDKDKKEKIEEKVKNKTDLKDPDEKKDNPEPFSFKDDQNRDLWWNQQPKAWDSAEEENHFELSQKFTRVESSVFNSLSLSNEEINSPKTVFPLFIDTDISEIQVSASADDAYMYGATYPGSNTATSLTSTSAWLGAGTTAYYNSGVRFLSVPIPQGATISSSSIKVNGYGVSSPDTTDCDVSIIAEAADNAATFATTGHTTASVYNSKTTASARWDIGTASWTSGTFYQSTDISSVVKEVTDRAGWSSGNALVFLFINTDSSLPASGMNRRIRTYNYSGNTYGAKFNASYTTGISVSGTCDQYDQSTDCADSETVKVAINGNLQAQTTTTSGGTWTISGVTVPSSSDTITVFVDGVTDDKEANAVTKYDGSGNITGVTLYERHLTIGSADNQTLSNADMNKYDASVSSDEDIFFDIDASDNLTIPYSGTSTYSDQELYILASNTWRPKSSSSCTSTIPNLEIPTSATLTADGNTIILTASGTSFVKTGTFTSSTSTFKYKVSEATNITAADYFNLELIDPPAEVDTNQSNDYTASDSSLLHTINQYVGIEQKLNISKPSLSQAQRDFTGTLQAQPGEKEIVEKRTRNFKTFDLGNGTYRVGGDISPIHYQVDPFDKSELFKEINLDILKTPYADYDYAMEQNGYQAYFWNKKTQNQNISDQIPYAARFQRAGHYLEMAPIALEWQNGKGEKQLILTPKEPSSEPIIDNQGHTVTWSNAFGDGVDFSYNLSPDKFFKTVIVKEKNSLPKATIDQQGLKLNVLMSFAWDNSVNLATDFSNDSKTILTRETIEKADEILNNPENYISTDNFQRELWSMQTPKAWDSKENPTQIDMDWNLARSGSSVIASILVPASFIESNDIAYPIYIDTAISEEQVGAGADDGDHALLSDSSETFNATSTQTNTGNFIVMGTTYSCDHWSRFTTVPIPNGATIDSATVKYDAAASWSDTTNLKFYGNDDDDATSPTSVATYNAKTRTTASVDWSSVPAWTAGTWYTSPDISSIVTEITARAGWSSNNSLLILLEDNESPSRGFRPISNYEWSGNVSGAKFNATYADKTLTLSSGTFNIGGNLTVGDGANAVVADADTNDPIINIDGDMEIKTLATFVASNSASFALAGDFTNAGTFTHSSGTVTLDGSSAQAITAGGSSFNNLKDSNTTNVVSQVDAVTVSGNLTIDASAIYDINGQNSTVGTLTNNGTYRLQGGETTVSISTMDTDSGTVEYDGTGTYTGLKAGSAYWALKINGSGGTFNLNSALDVNDDLTIAAGSLVANGYDITLAGDWSNSGTFTPGTKKVTLDGAAAQSVTCGGTDAGKTFYDLVSTNASASGVIFADSCTVSGTFTDITPSSKLTFQDGSTYSFAAININGSGAGDVTMTWTSSAHGHWHFIVPGTPTVTYVTVDHSDATGSGAQIDATSNCHDGDNNTYWNFGGAAPVNDSLTFENPYSSNIAVADDTTPWDFQAKVTDASGPTDIDYIEIRFADSWDSSQPFGDLKYRYTRSTDTFSEVADAHSVAAIDASSSASAVGNQWTVDFKIKFNDSFLAKNTNYAAELYSVDNGALSDDDVYADIYQVAALSISLDVDFDTIAFGNLLPGSVITGTTITTVTTNYPNGYSLSASDNVAGTNSALLHTDTTTRIADYAGTIAVPTSWTDTGLGICVYSATDKNGKWGTGTTETSALNKYAGVPQNATEIHPKTGAPTSSDESKIGYKLVVPNTQKTGAYSGNITYTATGVLN